MVIGVAEVAVVQEPDVADVEDLVVGAVEEGGEVLARLQQVRQPNHRRQVCLATLQESASELDLVGLLLVGGL